MAYKHTHLPVGPYSPANPNAPLLLAAQTWYPPRLMALWRPDAADAELELVGLALDFCRTRLAEGSEAEWIAAREPAQETIVGRADPVPAGLVPPGEPEHRCRREIRGRGRRRQGWGHPPHRRATRPTSLQRLRLLQAR